MMVLFYCILTFDSASGEEKYTEIKTYEYLAMGLTVIVSGVNPPPGGDEFVFRV